MARIAKIKITADTGAFKQDIEKVKASIRGLGSVEVETKGISSLKKTLTEDLKETEKELKSTISSLKGALTDLAKASTLDSEEINKNLKALNIYYERLKDVQELMKKDSGAYKFFDALDGANPFGRMNRGLGAIAGAAGAVGLGLGVGTLFQRQRGISTERNAIAALVGGPVTEEQSQLGFTSEERRQRLLEVARASGRNLSVEEQNRALSLGETAERAYGISAEQQGSFMGSARRAGVQDQQKAFAQAIGVATAAGLDGSRVGEYLAAMSDGIAQMSQGINVDTDSLQGFAGALSSLPFFASNPERAFRAIQGIASSFSTQTDRFQQAQSSRAILAGSPGASPSDVEFRRQMELFGKLPKEALEFYGNPKYGGNADIRKTLSLSGEEIVKNLFNDMMANTEGMSPTFRAGQLMNRLNLDAGSADELYRDLVQGKGVSASNMKKIREANMDPSQRINNTFNGFDAQVTRTGAKIEGAMDKMAKDITEAITSFDSALEISSDKLANFGTAVTVATATLTALSLASAAGSAGKKILSSDAMTKGAGLLAKGAGFLSKNASKIIPGVGLSLAAKDFYDIYEKKSSGKEVTSEDYMKAVMSGGAGVAGLFPGGQGISMALSTASMFSEGFGKNDPVTRDLMSKTSLPTPQLMSTVDSENTSATQQNTDAIIKVMEILRQVSTAQFSTSVRSRYPSEADFLPSNTGVGK